MERIVIEEVYIFTADDHATPLEKLVVAEAAVAGAPDALFYISSAELGVLDDPCLSMWLTSSINRHPTARHVFISMACTGWYAGVLEFMRSSVQRVFLIFLETPHYYVQACLDRAALGKGGEGLLAQECAAMVVLARKDRSSLGPGDMVISSCAILSKPSGLRGSEALIIKLKAWLQQHVTPEGPPEWVSFSIASRWSVQLGRGFEHWIVKEGLISIMHPSHEQDKRHWLTIKPLIELTLYRHRLSEAGMVISSLGAGGRLGAILIERVDSLSQIFSTPLIHAFDIQHARSTQPSGSPEMPMYCADAFRYRDNAYFRTEMLDLDFTPPFTPTPVQYY